MIGKLKITALLPMKGHSERVSNKNMKSFNGLPLYHAIAQELKDSKFIDQVIINTDSEVIVQDVNTNFPEFKIHQRPKELMGDMVAMNKIIDHDIQNDDADVFIQTHATNPLLLHKTFDEALNLFIEAPSDFDSIFSVTRYQTRLYWKDGSPINHDPKELLRTQDLPPVYEENSCFYIFTKESFKNSEEKRIGVKPLMHEIDKIEAIDIDENQDFIIAENLYKQLRKNN